VIKQFAPAIRLTLFLTVLTGLIYPGIITVLSQLVFPFQANGSVTSENGRIVGSTLIGQNFTKAHYFHPRPSAAGAGYDASLSSGSNLGPTNQKLLDRVKASEKQFRAENPDYDGSIPADALTASGSGLDPHISPANARAQISRIAKAREIDSQRIQELVEEFTEPRTLGMLGEPRVNVLLLNIALDKRFP
jgi:K+-transporting ATPase ATPase C chain